MLTSKQPFYIKSAAILVSIIAISAILYIGQDIIVPFIFSAFIAVLVNPIVNYLVSKKINRVLAIFITVLFTLLVIGGFVVFISTQIATFSESFPQFKQKFNDTGADVIGWCAEKLNVRTKEITAWIQNAKAEIAHKATASVGVALMAIGGTLMLIFVIPVYIFLILYYKPLFLEFIKRVFDAKDQPVVSEVVDSINTIIRGYLRGLLLEVGIVTTLNSIGLLILGVDYAILLGITGALFNLIPYVGILIALVMSVTVAFVTGSATTALLVVLLYVIVQFIDNNILVPYIVASQVKINAVISILAVITGNLLWGVAGMFLSIPLVALVKVVCDHIDSVKPLGYLLGDEMRVPGKKRLIGLKKGPHKAG